MAYTLKSAWASSVVACVAVDDDNTTVRDFVTANTCTVDANVTVGSATWKGVTRPYFQTLANGGTNFYGLTWSGTKPNLNYDPALSVMVLLNSYTSGSVVLAELSFSYGIVLSSGKPRWQLGVHTATTALATSTKQSFMGIYRNGGTVEWHYGLESGSMSQDATATDVSLPSDRALTTYGGMSGQGNFVANNHLLLVMNRVMTNTERDDIHSDYVGTLFDTASGSSVAAKMAQYRRRWSG